MSGEELKTCDIAYSESTSTIRRQNRGQNKGTNIQNETRSPTTSISSYLAATRHSLVISAYIHFHFTFMSRFQQSLSLFARFLLCAFSILVMLCYCNYSCNLLAFDCMLSSVPCYIRCTVYNCTEPFIAYTYILTFTDFILGNSKCFLLLVCGFFFFLLLYL